MVWDPDIISQTSAILPFFAPQQCSQVLSSHGQNKTTCVNLQSDFINYQLAKKENKLINNNKSEANFWFSEGCVALCSGIPCLNLLFRPVVMTGRDHGQESSQESCFCCTGDWVLAWRCARTWNRLEAPACYRRLFLRQQSWQQRQHWPAHLG